MSHLTKRFEFPRLPVPIEILMCKRWTEEWISDVREFGFLGSFAVRRLRKYNAMVIKAMALAWEAVDRERYWRDYQDVEIPIFWRRKVFSQTELNEITYQLRQGQDIEIPR